MATVRFRRTSGRRWRPAHLHTTPVRDPDTRQLLAEVIDDRTGATRTLDPNRVELEVLDGGRWRSLEDWADTTAPLFAAEPKDRTRR